MLLLAIDDHSLPFKRHLTYYLSKPDVRKEPVLTPSLDDPNAPDHMAAFFYGTVLYDEGRFRMWHYAKNEELPKPHESSMICYAESNDGVQWTKPNLGQKEFKGNCDNNALNFPGRQTYGASVIKDDEDPDPQRRYKMVYNPVQESGLVADRFGHGVSTLGTATSPDGIHWSANSEWPIDVFAEQSSFYKYDGMYYVHGQGIFYGGGEGGSEHGRQGYVWVSKDFTEWVQGWAEAFTLPEPVDPSERGFEFSYDQVHLGVGAANFGNVQVGLVGLWHMADAGEITDLEGTTCDLALVVSNDGIHFREPVKGHVYISHKDSQATPAQSREYPTILCQYNGILSVGDETRIYHGRWRNAGHTDHLQLYKPSPDYYSEVALATLPRDRWGSLGLFPNQLEGWVWSAPITLKDHVQITLNADYPDLMRVELSEDRFGLLPEYSGQNSGILKATGGLESTVVWPTQDLSCLRNSRVRLRVNMKRGFGLEPRLYAIYLRDV